MKSVENGTWVLFLSQQLMGHTILPCLSQHFLLQNEKFELDESFSEMVLDGQKSHSCFRVLCY